MVIRYKAGEMLNITCELFRFQGETKGKNIKIGFISCNIQPLIH